MANMGASLAKVNYERGWSKGREEGRTEGEDILSKLIQFLIKAGKQNEIPVATSDAEARKEMYKKYNIL